MPDFKPEELKQLLTAAELRLVESSQPPTLAKLTEAKLKKQITLTRKARDKWRDQSTRQRRDVQRAQGSRVTDAAARSAEKNKILTKALNDLQKQLDKIGSGAAEPGTKAPSPKGPSKQKRAKGHRESRAEVRELLEEKRTKLTGKSAGKKAAKKTVAKKKVAKKKTATKKAVKKTPAKKVAAKKTAGKKKVAAKKVAASAVSSAKPSAAKKKTAKKNSLAQQSTDGWSGGPPEHEPQRPARNQHQSQEGTHSAVGLDHADTRSRFGSRKALQGPRDSRG